MAEQPTIDEIVSKVDAIKTSVPPENRKQELINLIDGFCDESYEAGSEDAIEDYEPDDKYMEKANSEYVVGKFADCTTFEQFQSIYNEIRNISYSYMK